MPSNKVQILKLSKWLKCATFFLQDLRRSLFSKIIKLKAGSSEFCFEWIQQCQWILLGIKISWKKQPFEVGKKRDHFNIQKLVIGGNLHNTGRQSTKNCRKVRERNHNNTINKKKLGFDGNKADTFKIKQIPALFVNLVQLFFFFFCYLAFKGYACYDKWGSWNTQVKKKERNLETTALESSRAVCDYLSTVFRVFAKTAKHFDKHILAAP